jgi:UDP-glucose 4-epimerase
VISEVTHAPIETHDASYTYDELAQLGVDISKAEKYSTGNQNAI